MGDACAPDLQTVGGSLSADAATRTCPRLRRGTRWRSRRANLSPAKRKRRASRRFASGRPRTPWSRLPAAFDDLAASLPPSQRPPLRLHGALRPGRAGAACERPVRGRRAVGAARCSTRRRGVRRTARRDHGRHPVCGAQLRTRHPERRHPCRRRGRCPLLGLARPRAAPPRWLLPLPVPRRMPTQPPGHPRRCPGAVQGIRTVETQPPDIAAPVAGCADAACRSSTSR